MAENELFALRDLPKAIHGQVVFSVAAAREEDRTIFSVAIDSRTVREGCLFVALAGSVTDGHHYVQEAVDAGAAAALVHDDRDPDGREWSVPVIQVSDTLVALQQLAAWYARTVLSGTTRIGITGSNGKTTTKEMVAAILRGVAPTSASAGNLNSETGVPLAVFDTDPESTYAVYEMAMNHPGEMEPLAEIVNPDYAIITNIGTAHIGHLGSRDAIAQEKKAVSSRFSGTQYLLIPEGDEYVEYLRDAVRGTVLLFGPHAQNARVDTRSEPGSVVVTEGSVDGFEERYAVPVGGYHNGLNALAAIALARALGISTDAIRRGLATVSAPAGRSEILHGPGGRRILNDSYNANPDSLNAALQMVRTLHGGKGSLILILGAMKELGDIAEEAHRSALTAAAEVNPALVVLVGTGEWERAGGEKHSENPERLDAGGEVWRVSSGQEAIGVLRDHLTGGETVLLKGSRSVALEELLPFLTGEEDA